MSVYMTEEEQLEQIKKWWKQYGHWVTTGLSIVMLCFAGYRYSLWHEQKVTQQASVAYENMMVAFSNQNIKDVRSYANELISGYGKSVYADAAHMTLSKIYVSRKKLDKAQAELQLVAEKSKMPALRQIAKIRIARLLAADKNYDAALKELDSLKGDIYLPVLNEIKGDIYGATGKYQEAIVAYRQALDQVKTNGMGNLFLEMKTNEIASKSQSQLTEENKVQAA